jgi:hypothetical protein
MLPRLLGITTYVSSRRRGSYVEERPQRFLVHLDVELLHQALALIQGQAAALVLVRVLELLLQEAETDPLEVFYKEFT